MSADNTAAPAEIREVAVARAGHHGRGHRRGARPQRPPRRRDRGEPQEPARGLTLLHVSLDKAVARGRLSHAGKAEIVGRVRAADSIATGVAGADLVIEAVPEGMDIKRAIFAELD